ncbi:hypothetical protein G4B88_009913, partial [Cannabis sativa]
MSKVDPRRTEIFLEKKTVRWGRSDDPDGSGPMVPMGPVRWSRWVQSDGPMVQSDAMGPMLWFLLGSDVYATTASNATEDSWAEYCPNFDAPQEYDTCLGDLYNISWLENRDMNDVGSETLLQQYEL